MMGVYGRRCLRPGCRGTVSFEVCDINMCLKRPHANARVLQYSDAQLYTQLRYYLSLFSAEKVLKGAAGPKSGWCFV